MAVDLSDLLDSLSREISPPGTDLYPDATEDELLGQLRDAFWEGKLLGFWPTYGENEGIVQAEGSTTDLPRELQQLIVLIAGVRIVRMKLMNTNTQFRAKAGSVEFETANSASLLKEILTQLQGKIALLVETLGSLSASQTGYLDAIVSRDESIAYGETPFWAASRQYRRSPGNW